MLGYKCREDAVPPTPIKEGLQKVVPADFKLPAIVSDIETTCYCFHPTVLFAIQSFIVLVYVISFARLSNISILPTIQHLNIQELKHMYKLKFI
jgi:hypothetical protein